MGTRTAGAAYTTIVFILFFFGLNNRLKAMISHQKNWIWWNRHAAAKNNPAKSIFLLFSLFSNCTKKYVPNNEKSMGKIYVSFSVAKRRDENEQPAKNV